MRCGNSRWRILGPQQSGVSNCARSRSCWGNSVEYTLRVGPDKQCDGAVTALPTVMENEKGTVNMATKELVLNASRLGNSSGFIFDVSLPTAIAPDGEGFEFPIDCSV